MKVEEVIARALAAKSMGLVKSQYGERLSDALWQGKLKTAEFLVSALDAAGYVIVPNEPTEKMLAAGWCAPTSGDAYRRMIAAAKEE